MRRLLTIVALCCLLVVPAYAEPELDTASSLEQTIIPYRDRVDLSRRLLDVNEIAPPPVAVPERKVGDQRGFWITNEFANSASLVDATLQAVGESIYLWVESGVDIDSRELEVLADAFDSEIYPAVRDLWGSENTPGIDGDPRVYGLFAFGMGPSVAAYFSSEHTNPIEAVSTSNEHEMFFFNLDTLGTTFSSAALVSTVAHEFQHMIRQHQDLNEQTWLDEGFSKFTEVYLGYGEQSLGTAGSFLGRPQTQLNTWPENAPRLPHYGAGMLFVTYFYERYGLEALRMAADSPFDGLTAFDDALRAMGEGDVDTFFADWVLANFLRTDPAYGYTLLTRLSGPPPLAVINTYPYKHTGVSNQYATDYLVLTNLDGLNSLELQLVAPETVALVPVKPASGQRMWYSNRADESDTTLTQAFDLRGVTSATLQFRVWYHLEHLWDYGYVMISTDEGQTWDVLSTPHSTLENPHNNAYGPGYTGDSGGWLDESLSLDAYAGKQILVRFEVITDDATNQPGMVIDDVQIPEIEYSSDFESDDGGWIPAGWVWTDNTLPQQVWVQAIQQIGGENWITRWLAPEETAWTLPLENNVDQVVVAVSPFAPVTTVAMPYELHISAR